VLHGGVGTIEGPIVGVIVFYALQRYLAARHLVSDFARRTCDRRHVVRPKGVWGYVAQRYRVALFPVRRMLVRPYERRLIAFLGGDAPPARNELARYPWFRSLLILRMLLGNAFALCIAATETNPERAYHGDP
jgi:hypothetical protein